MVLRWLVGNLVREHAADAAKNAFDQARKSSQAEQPQQQQSTRPAPCDVGILFALEMEAGGLLDRLQETRKTKAHGFTVYEGTLAGRSLVIVVSGPGQEKARRATGSLIDGHRPKWVISSGLAGGLQENIARGDLFIATSVSNLDRQTLTIDVQMESADHRHLARLLSVDSIVRLPEEKRKLAAAHDAAAVDMETFACASCCQERKVRFLSVRAISDTVEDTLPPEVQNVLDQESVAGKLGAVAGSLFHRPGSLKDFWKLREDALVASDKLAKFLSGMIFQLIPQSEADEPSE